MEIRERIRGKLRGRIGMVKGSEHKRKRNGMAGREREESTVGK